MGKIKAQEEKRKSFDLMDKKRIIDEAKVAKAKGESLRSVARKLGINHTTILNILKSEKAIVERITENPSTIAKVYPQVNMPNNITWF